MSWVFWCGDLEGLVLVDEFYYIEVDVGGLMHSGFKFSEELISTFIVAGIGDDGYDMKVFFYGLVM